MAAASLPVDGSAATPTSATSAAADSPRLPPARSHSPTVALLDSDLLDDEGRRAAKKAVCSYCNDHDVAGPCQLKGRAFFQKLQTPNKDA